MTWRCAPFLTWTLIPYRQRPTLLPSAPNQSRSHSVVVPSTDAPGLSSAALAAPKAPLAGGRPGRERAAQRSSERGRGAV
jgi:hypothetical protein